MQVADCLQSGQRCRIGKLVTYLIVDVERLGPSPSAGEAAGQAIALEFRYRRLTSFSELGLEIAHRSRHATPRLAQVFSNAVEV